MNFLRESDKTCHELADIQARIFAMSAKEKLPSLYFIRAFMCLSETRSMDDLSFLHGNLSEQELFQLAASHLKSRRGTLFSEAEMHWIGYIYRAMAYISKTSSRELVTKAPPKYLRSVYPMYHTLDIVAAINKIDLDTIKPGQSAPESKLVEILRSTYGKWPF